MRETRAFRVLATPLLVLLFLAFATGTMAARTPDSEDFQLEALFLAGASPNDLCLSDDGSTHDHPISCSFCIAFGPATRATPDLTEIDAFYVGQVVRPQITWASRHRLDLAVPPRGPPFMLSVLV